MSNQLFFICMVCHSFLLIRRSWPNGISSYTSADPGLQGKRDQNLAAILICVSLPHTQLLGLLFIQLIFCSFSSFPSPLFCFGLQGDMQILCLISGPMLHRSVASLLYCFLNSESKTNTQKRQNNILICQNPLPVIFCDHLYVHVPSLFIVIFDSYS